MRLARLLVVAMFGSAATPAVAQDVCNEVKLALLAETQNVECTASPDLTTTNPNTTPQDNSRAGLPPSAFTPRTDAQAVSPDAPYRTPLTRAVPGLQVTGGMADDPDARWVLRLPEAWNGKLVVVVPGGLRSEFMGDYIFSDFVVQQGYAYASTNKGRSTSSSPSRSSTRSPAGCRRRRQRLRLPTCTSTWPSRKTRSPSGSAARSRRPSWRRRRWRPIRRAPWSALISSASRTAGMSCAACSPSRRRCTTAASTGRACTGSRAGPTS